MLSFIWAATLINLVIPPDGTPVRTFDSHGKVGDDEALIIAVRGQEIKSTDCNRWITALINREIGKRTSPGDFTAWAPWTNSEKDAILDCDDMPCKVKLKKNEIVELEKIQEKEKRFEKYLSFVSDRTARYLKDLDRPGYEFPTAPVDPWAYFESVGLHSELAQPQKSKPGVLLERIVDLAPNQLQMTRQILDWVTARNATEGVVWIRDVYTDHYFDTWGEWGQVRCDSAKGTIRVTLAMFFELDMLKKKDFFSMISRGRMRSISETISTQYLDHWYDDISGKK